MIVNDNKYYTFAYTRHINPLARNKNIDLSKSIIENKRIQGIKQKKILLPYIHMCVFTREKRCRKKAAHFSIILTVCRSYLLPTNIRDMK